MSETKKLNKTVKVAEGITLNVNQNPAQEYVPSSHPFQDSSDNTLGTLGFAIKENMPVLLVGETGVGKTSAIRYLANKTNNAFRRLNLNGQVTVDEFVGKILINKEGTYWVDGILTDALRHGHWLLLDELNAALPEVLFVLQSLLDDDRYIVLSDKEDKEIVRPHENFRIFATMNPSDGGNYTGTKDLNKALMSRFPIVLDIKFPEPHMRKEIIDTQIAGSDIWEAEKTMLINIGNDLRNSYQQEEMDFVFSTRDLINWVKMYKYTKNWKEAAKLAFLGKCNQTDREAIAAILDVQISERPVDATEEPDGSSNFTIPADALNEGDLVMLTEDVPVHDVPMIFRAGTIVETQSDRQKNLTSANGKPVTVSEAGLVMFRALSVPQGEQGRDRRTGRATNPHATEGTYWAVAKTALTRKMRSLSAEERASVSKKRSIA